MGEWAAVGSDGIRAKARKCETLLQTLDELSIGTDAVTIVLRRDGKVVSPSSPNRR
jgi:hypothetical protein